MNRENIDDKLIIEQLREEIELKTKWLSLIAHDFKGLFSNVKFLLDALANKSIPQEIFVSMLPELKQIAEKNSKTLESTFAWVNSQTDGLSLHLEDVVIHNLFSELIEELDEEVSAKAVSIKFEGGIDVSIATDKFLLKFILKQIVENAIKYSNKGGVIEVVVYSDSNSVNIKIKDNGVGMKDSSANNIGTLDGAPFTGTMGEKGAGLSLVVVKCFVEMLNGEMSVSSILGKGTSVELDFPQG